MNGHSPVTIHGSDYSTKDGTAIRDYVHVDDLADAHVRAMERLEPGYSFECNLGTGRGFSVQEILQSARRVTGFDIQAVIGPRRPGDPPVLYADSSRAKTLLGWEAACTEPDQIISSAWDWHCRHPKGYGGHGRG
jgi:UDP-glucose 4-epimerase